MQSSTHRHRSRARTITALAVLASPPLALLGCTSPTAPPMAPSGGETIVLSYSEFVQKVEPVFVRRGCDATGDCHGGGIRGTFALSPDTAPDAKFDFDQAVLQVWPAYRDSSDLLTRPLAGGTPHPYKPFASTADTDYVAIRTWIYDGVIH